ncbi:uncharacterized protein KNAG_0M01760 [Huiozyma naganishii CBS 8797]|uniref:sterol esterase n=1 Tax=Huiozyma naganishii (strain ATCC MYA-139 / BCRC 22969 / CBS 8797 / KCTC 17520 / NBRC 10181 / NCYC 3082 / Yp74L-3) TaxID=1071383 RepID=J7SAT7_HUIN7|nr:hypothetical protein KNAG_0M01760 [Kazachstania naganishii CBS 8797]CCK73029.1 hypothetical protein KNAG_0M01760 [Kazachstania naganishii CBS 8797]
MLLDVLQQFTSALILYVFLSVLFVLSLWNNYITVHFKQKSDPRDKRSASKKYPKETTGAKKTRRYSRVSISSTTPLDIESDDENNIEYDHTITLCDHPGHQFRYDNNRGIDDRVTANPFEDILNMEDSRLVPDLKYYYKQYNIDIEEFEVETDDGFIIDLWHLIPRDNFNGSPSNKYPVLMLHGLLQSSGSFASCGRKSLAYYFLANGFDVWLGNNRCGFHPKWNLNKVQRKQKWDWDMTEMVQFDLKALVTEVLSRNTRFEKLTLMAHSQGTTQSFMGLINGPKFYKDDKDGFNLVDNLDNFVALAPAVYPGPLLDEKHFVKFMAHGIDHQWVFGKRSFMPLMMKMRSLMAGTKPFSFLSYVMFNYMFDWNDSLWDKPLRDRNFLFSPVHISVKLMKWWLSPDPAKNSFKHGADRMFPPNKSWFPVADASTPVEQSDIHLNETRSTANEFPQLLVFIPRQDRLVNGEKLVDHFTHHEDNSVYKIWYIDEYSHLDVLWAHDVIDRIGQQVITHMRNPAATTKEVKTETTEQSD